HRIVALKMILPNLCSGAEELARFRTEAEAAGRLQHPNVVHVYEIGEHAGRPYFSMEFVDGPTLAVRMAGTPHSPFEAAALLETLARAVHHAHERGVIHRDLKPANVLLQQEVARQGAKDAKECPALSSFASLAPWRATLGTPKSPISVSPRSSAATGA